MSQVVSLPAGVKDISDWEAMKSDNHILVHTPVYKRLEKAR